ncbi:hypothetical protein [Paenibacillus pabuli]|uniref:hypothetical protein n=1 Tax=Paenibacillus pabuli TaxID=1472 RepID=UPI0007832F0B|nr:hypothetical protein [Paenibacillus pabuli]MEC0123378.1 hypothetical protein [Paenibacillus pabuli]
MREIQLFLLVSSFSLFAFACSNSVIEKSGSDLSEKDNIETVVTHGNYKEFDKENKLFDDADLVVIAKTDSKFVDREHVVKYADPDAAGANLPQAIEDFYTKTPINVLKVLKSSASATITKNNEMIIIEPVSLIEEDAKSKKISIENYNEISEGEKYVLYLKQNTYGDYSVINMNNGRFSLESEELNINSMDHGHENDMAKHNELKQNIEERFKSEIEEVKEM